MNNASDPPEATGRPRLTVVMPALNAAATIGAALDSVAGLAGTIEAIVADGGSADGTAAVAGRYPFVRVLTAPGSSIYEALNLALAEARAPVIAWLNADDLFLPGALDAALEAFAAAPDADILRGLPHFVRSDAAGWQQHETRIEARAAGTMTLALITRGPLSINSMLFRREALSRVGPFDTSYRLSADREWMLRAWRAGLRIVELGRPLYCYRVHSGSSTLDPGRRNHLRARAEHEQILRTVLPPALALDRRDPVRVELRRWHAVEAGLRLQAAVAARSWSAAVRIAVEAGRTDPVWPLILVGQAVARLRDRSAAAPGDLQ
jgi:glycosyltransferase involved in cell wall biosynthesis